MIRILTFKDVGIIQESSDVTKGAPASKRPGVDFFHKANSAGLTDLPNQKHFYI